MSVQWVNRPNLDFRGFSGRIASGSVKPGDSVRISPSGVTSRIKEIAVWGGPKAEATAGQSVTLVLEDEVDASRGTSLRPLHIQLSPLISLRQIFSG